MPRKLISSGSTFEATIGYSRAVVVDNWIFVSGTTGFDYSTMSIADDLVAQTEQCLKNIEAALREAGSGLPTCCPTARSSSAAGRCSARPSARSAPRR